MFDVAVLEAKRSGDPAKVKLLKAFGRERAEPLLIEAAGMIQKDLFAKWGGKSSPTLLDLIEPELEKFDRERRQIGR